MTQFELFDFQDQHQAKLKEIRSKPIVLKLGKYECWVENGQIHYTKWVKNKENLLRRLEEKFKLTFLVVLEIN